MLLPTKKYQVIPVSPGIAIGRVMRLYDTSSPVFRAETKIQKEDAAEELARFELASRLTGEQLEELCRRTRSRTDGGEAGIFEAQKLFSSDRKLLENVRSLIRVQGYSAEYAIFLTIGDLSDKFNKLKDAYLRERVDDLRDVGQRLIRNLSNGGNLSIKYQEPRIVIAGYLSPSETAGMDTSKVLGFAVENGSTTSHTAILARSLRLPAVVGMPRELLEQLGVADKIIVDGNRGVVIVNPDDRTEEAYRLRREAQNETYRKLVAESNLPSETTDGFRLELAANIDADQNYREFKEAGASGIGLFRTEFLFTDPTRPPSEDEQFEVYKKLLISADGHPVTIRTIDAGGDKFVTSVMWEKEPNPFLGLRGIRFCLSGRRDIFDAQLRALLRAGVYGDLRVMLPMITCIDEIRQTRNIIRELQEQLNTAGIPCAGHLPVGVMIETPAAALMADVLAAEAEFFSIGTNDLIQYTMAADRINGRVVHLYRPGSPAVLKLIRQTVNAAEQAGIPVTVCGLMSEETEFTPLLVGLGVNELSMSITALPRQRQMIRQLSRRRCTALVDKALRCADSTEVRALLRDFAAGNGLKTVEEN